tara:strand:+ start:1440 stop:1700 length:261 start_codon:yes stop_codon:yes gene_type:complete
MGHISKTQEKRWFCAETAGNAHVFGIAILGSVLDTGQSELEVFLTEDELEVYVDSELGEDAYKEAVETGSDRFMGTSQKYPAPTLI